MSVIPSVGAPATIALNPSGLASLPTGQASAAIPSGKAIGNDVLASIPFAAGNTLAVANADSLQINEVSLTANTSQADSSAPFLAQLLGQDTADDESPVALAYTTTQFAPATEYNRLVAYSYVKYKPSDAGLQASSDAISLPEATAISSQTDSAASLVSGGDYQAYSNTQARNTQSITPAFLSRLSIAG